MAKRRSSSRKKRLTLKPVVKQIESHIKTLRKMKTKKGSTPQQKKQMDRHIKHLHRVRMIAMDGCDEFILAID